MNYRSAILTVLMTSPAVSGQEAVFESKGWPGEGIPVLIARHSELAVYASPDLRSAQGKVRYRIGWRIPFADSLQRTLTEAEVRTVGAGSVEVWCNDNREKLQLTILAGESWTYLQYSSEGFVTAQIRDKICQLPAYTEEAIFGTDLPRPDVQWWVKVRFADASSPGWLLVTEDQVQYGPREF